MMDYAIPQTKQPIKEWREYLLVFMDHPPRHRALRWWWWTASICCPVMTYVVLVVVWKTYVQLYSYGQVSTACDVQQSYDEDAGPLSPVSTLQ
jgi:hypothetical protein